MGKPIYARFTTAHYDEDRSRFELRFQDPQTVPANEWINLFVSIISPEWAGQTGTGDLVVVYDGSKQLVIKGVQVDALDSDDPPDESGLE